MQGLCSGANVRKQTNSKHWPQCRKRSVWSVLHQACWFMCQWVLMLPRGCPSLSHMLGAEPREREERDRKRETLRLACTHSALHPAFVHTKTRPPASSTSHPACFISHTHTLLRLYTTSQPHCPLLNHISLRRVVEESLV